MSVNKLILKQLEQVKNAKVEAYDPIKHSYLIKKHQEIVFDVNHVYIVELNDSLVHPSQDDLLVSNWNNGTHPVQKYMKLEVTKKLAKMIYVYGVYYNIETNVESSDEWDGWLPQESLVIIKEV